MFNIGTNSLLKQIRKSAGASNSLLIENALDTSAVAFKEAFTNLGSCFSFTFNAANYSFLHASHNSSKFIGIKSKYLVDNGPDTYVSIQDVLDQTLFAEETLNLFSYVNSNPINFINRNIVPYLEIKLRTNSGDTRWFLKKVTDTFLSGNKIYVNINVLTDITHLKKDGYMKAYWIDKQGGNFTFYRCRPTDSIIKIGLTYTELEVVNLLADGKTNQEISDFLYVTKDTVKTHRKNIINKLPVKNSLHLIKFACKNRLIVEDNVREMLFEGINLNRKDIDTKSIRTNWYN